MYNPPWQSSGDIGCLKYVDFAQAITFTLQPTAWNDKNQPGLPGAKGQHMAFLSLHSANIWSQGKRCRVAPWLLFYLFPFRGADI